MSGSWFDGGRGGATGVMCNGSRFFGGGGCSFFALNSEIMSTMDLVEVIFDEAGIASG